MKILKNLLFVILAVFFCENLFSQNQPIKQYSKGDISIEAYDFDGLKQFLHQKEDKIYVINFWATWCGPCVAELPSFENITKKYPTSQVEVILVSLDMRKQVESKLLPFLIKKKLQSKVIYLEDINFNDWIDQVDPEWSGALPATLLYKGDDRSFYEKQFTFEELEKIIESKL